MAVNIIETLMGSSKFNNSLSEDMTVMSSMYSQPFKPHQGFMNNGAHRIKKVLP